MKHLLVALLPLAPLGLASSRGLPLPSCMLLFEPGREGTTPLKMGLLSRKIPPCVSVAELSASYASTEELLLKMRSIAGKKINSSGKRV